MGREILTPREAEKLGMLVKPGDTLYKVTDLKRESVAYDMEIQSIAYIHGTVVAMYEEWVRSFFPKDYFNHIHIKDSSAIHAFKSFMRDIYRKEKPILCISLDSAELDESSIYAMNMINRFNNYDPSFENMGTRLSYASQIVETQKAEIWYRPNRYVFEFSFMVMVSTAGEQLNLYNKLIMSMRNNSKFTLERMMEHPIPNKYLEALALLYKADYLSDAFLNELNARSCYPIVKRELANKVFKFYMLYPVSLHFDINGFPQKDSPERTAAYTHGARVQHRTSITVDLPAEFMLIARETTEQITEIMEANSKDIYVPLICPDMDWPTSIGTFNLCNRMDIVIDAPDPETNDLPDNTLNVIDAIGEYDHVVAASMLKYMGTGRLEATDCIQCAVYPNGSYIKVHSILDPSGILTITTPIYGEVCTVNVYLDMTKLNALIEEDNTEMAGTIRLD